MGGTPPSPFTDKIFGKKGITDMGVPPPLYGQNPQCSIWCCPLVSIIFHYRSGQSSTGGWNIRPSPGWNFLSPYFLLSKSSFFPRFIFSTWNFSLRMVDLCRKITTELMSAIVAMAIPWQETMLFLALSQSCNKPVSPNFSNYSTYFPHFSPFRSDFLPLVKPKRDNWTNTRFFWTFTTFILEQEH